MSDHKRPELGQQSSNSPASSFSKTEAHQHAPQRPDPRWRFADQVLRRMPDSVLIGLVIAVFVLAAVKWLAP